MICTCNRLFCICYVFPSLKNELLRLNHEYEHNELKAKVDQLQNELNKMRFEQIKSKDCKHEPIYNLVGDYFTGAELLVKCKHCGAKLKAEKWVAA